VLKYKNQRLAEQLEVHKFEFRALESRFNDLKEKQRTHNETLILVENYWERVSCSNPCYCNIYIHHTHRLSAEIPLSKQLVAELGIVPVCKSESSHSSCSTGNNNIRKGMELRIYWILHCCRTIHGRIL
jgi:E3 ubiquitin-protein ligase BRE1